MKSLNQPHRASFKVYYEDTDALGIVYYANYFRFLERGRSDFLADSGSSVAELNRQGYLIVVHSVQANFKAAAELGDMLDVVTSFSRPSPFRGRFAQRIERGDTLIVDATVDVACLNTERRLIKLPEAIPGA